MLRELLLIGRSKNTMEVNIMDQIEAIIAYVLRTPYNTNPNILRGMLKKLAGKDPGEVEEEVYGEINDKKYGTDQEDGE